MTIFFHRFSTKIGEMALSWNELGILAVHLPESGIFALKNRIRARFPKCEIEESEMAPANVLSLQKKIQAHLSGVSQKFSLKELSTKQLPEFHREVYRMALKIPSGKVLTYGELAKLAGSPKAFRAVGQAMAKNPFPIVIPCHRVVAAGKKPGGYSAFGGVDTKARILAIEAPGKDFF